MGVFVLLTVLSFFSFSGGEGGKGGMRATAMKSISLLENAPVTVLAEVNNSTPEALIEILKGQGITVENAEQDLSEIAEENQKDPMQLLQLIINQ